MKLVFVKTTMLALTLFATACSTKIEQKEAAPSLYPEIPREELLGNSKTAKTVYQQLSARYTEHVLTLKKEVEANGAKFLMLYLTPECGNSLTQAQRSGSDYILSFIQTNHIDSKNLTPLVENKLNYTLMPKDGHWSKQGAAVIAGELNTWLRGYAGYTAPSNSALQNKPNTFGDLDPSQDAILDGGKDLPYRVITNSQGLRMESEVQFPKKKQRIVLLGDSELFCPFLDIQDGIAEQLQQLYPEVNDYP